jgi:hypothetical protein
MDEDLKDLEEELANLRPAVVQSELRARVARRLDQRLASNLLRVWWTFPAAAALAFGLVLELRRIEPQKSGFSTIASVQGGADSSGAVSRMGNGGRPQVEPAAESANEFKPIEAIDLLCAKSDEGAVTLEDGTLARRTSESHLDTIFWRDPGSGASLYWTVPRDEIRVIPVNFQ